MAAFKCPHCGAGIQFDPELGSMRCEYCGSEITLQDYSDYLKDDSNSYVARSMVCTQCGAELLTTDVTAATFCSYCGSPTLVPGRMIEEKRPDVIVPFKIKKARAEQIYRDEVRGSFFAPDWLKSEDGIAKVRGIYMPFYSYHFEYKGSYKGKADKTYTRGSYDYKEVYDLEADVKADFDDLLVDASRAFPDNLSGALYPYDLKKGGKEFEPSYLGGFYADISDVKPELYGDTFRALAEDYISKPGERVAYNGAGVSRKTVAAGMHAEPESMKTAFLPVWFLHFKNKDRISYAVISGDSGRIAMDKPVDFGKYLSLGVIIAALICLVLNFLVTPTPKVMLLMCLPLLIAGYIYANKNLNMLYRTRHHLNDRGAGAADGTAGKVKLRKPHPFLKVVLTIVLTLFFWSFFIAALSIEAEALAIIIMLASPVLAWTIADKIFGGSIIRKKKAPFYYKAYTLGKLIAGFAAIVWVLVKNPFEDMYYYVTGAAVMLLIIWSFFDIVNAHNRLTMRDIPIFTEERAEG